MAGAAEMEVVAGVMAGSLAEAAARLGVVGFLVVLVASGPVGT